MKFPSAPGVFDIVPHNDQEAWKTSSLWTYVETMIREIAKEYGYQEIRTPLFERTELFERSVGQESDIVKKEMYTFKDKGDRSMTLRPEGTAPVMRAFIEGQLHRTSSIHKLFYIGPMFRYERAQAGRYRQHHQFGAEAIGNNSPEQDAELIDLLYSLYQRLGLTNLSLFINSIGNEDSRNNFRQALKDYLRPRLSLLSPDSQTRFETNPLRILDSKDPRDKEIIQGAPSILDFLNEESNNHFERLKELLDLLKIPYQVNPFLVRGLDYYNQTVFEIVAGELGAQNSIGGGGRYDGLIQSLGGPDLPSIGFGTGIERIIQAMIGQEVALPKPDRPRLFLIPLGEAAQKACFSLLRELRLQGVPSQMDFSGKKLGKAMQYADQIKAVYVAVIGEQELVSQEVELKEMETGHKFKIALADLCSVLSLEIKGEAFMDVWKEMNSPFQSEGQAQFFLEKLSASLTKTQKLTEKFQRDLEKTTKLAEE